MRESFVFYKSFYDAIETFPKHSQLRFSPAYKVWRQEVLKKDNFTCQYCGKKSPEVQLHAHHIKMFATNEEERFYVDNGITLCHECHKKVHSKEIAICQN